MKNAALFVAFVLIGFTGYFLFQKRTVNTHKPLTKTTPFSIDTPPSESLKGTIKDMSGDLEWQSRSATEPAKLEKKEDVLQGEEFWTKETSDLAIAFPGSASIAMGANTHVNFIQTLPDHFVVAQDTGTVTYMLETASPLSVRSHSLLIQQNSGEMMVDVTNTIDISVISGTVTVAFNDAANTSKVVKLVEGDTYSFDTDAKEGKISRVRD